MRRIFLATLAAIPALALAQTSTVHPSQSSAILVAKATPPAMKASSSAAAPAAIALPANLVIQQAADADVSAAITAANHGVIQSINQASAPQLIKVVKTQLLPQELAATSHVSVRLTVDRDGIPQNLAVLSATSPAIARKTLEAVSQYRFKPATVNFAPVAVPVVVDVKIGE